MDPHTLVLIIFTLLVIFQLKAFIVDVPVKTSIDQNLAEHCNPVTRMALISLIHGIFTFTIVLVFSYYLSLAIQMAIVDTMLRIIIGLKSIWSEQNIYIHDSVESRSRLLFNQMLRHLSHYLVILLMLHSNETITVPFIII